MAENHPSGSDRLLADAEVVYHDILARVRRLYKSPESSSFQPLVCQLRRAIDIALIRRQGSGTNA